MTEMSHPGTTSAPDGGYLSIPLASLRADTILDFDVYVAPRKHVDPVLYRTRSLPITQDILNRLGEHRHTSIFVHNSQQVVYNKYVEGNLRRIVADVQIPLPERSTVAYSAAQGLMKEVMAAPRSDELLRRSREMVATIVQFMSSENRSFEQLMKLISFNYQTYTHSVNVFVFAIALARRTGYTDPEELQDFGEGLLLHDVGKSMIDPAIVNCSSLLTYEQFQEMMLHPGYGHEILRERGGFGDIALDVVRHHHEKMHGGGYPDDLRHNKLSPFVRMSTIADVFDAMTTQRMYQDAMKSYPALHLMEDEMIRDLDPDLLKAFIEMMGNPSE